MYVYIIYVLFHRVAVTQVFSYIMRKGGLIKRKREGERRGVKGKGREGGGEEGRGRGGGEGRGKGRRKELSLHYFQFGFSKLESV